MSKGQEFAAQLATFPLDLSICLICICIGYAGLAKMHILHKGTCGVFFETSTFTVSHQNALWVSFRPSNTLSTYVYRLKNLQSCFFILCLETYTVDINVC